MKTNNEAFIHTAISKAIETVAKQSGVSEKTVKSEIETALEAALNSSNPRLLSFEKAKGAPLLPEDVVQLVLLRFALLGADDGQN